MRLISAILFSTACLLVPGPLVAAPSIHRSPTELRVNLDNGALLSFALSGDQLLGLQTASVDGMALKSDATVLRPFLLQEWTERAITWESLHLSQVDTEGQTVRIQCALQATDDPSAIRQVLVFQGDTPHRDEYRFAHVQLPSERCRTNALPVLSTNHFPCGELTWVFEPVTLNVAGWPWRGWKHHYEVSLPRGTNVNCLRELGTWELQGKAQGNTLVSMRYRGLGGIVCTVDPHTSFTTTETLPDSVSRKGPVVSPALPGPQNVAGREDGMAYRHGAWIAQMQRGAGVNWVDFQYRPEAALAAWYDRMEAIRSLTEVWPGDTQLSQTDCLYVPQTNRFSTVPKTHVALTTPLPEHEWHTRWQEVDQFVRDHLSRELRFVQSDPLPTLGVNIDNAWESRIQDMIRRVDSWKAAGIKRVLVHHPGWFNGRGLRQHETSYPIPLDSEGKPDTGGDCSIHDYVPQSDRVRDLWIELTGRLHDSGIEYWVWITGMVYGTGPVVQNFGTQRFCRNSPDVDTSSGYPGKPPKAGHRAIPIRNPDIQVWWQMRMDSAMRELGVRGFWADSFQNMFMSQMNYQHADWAPHVREWWDWIAAVSRQGAGFMAESQAFPGLSCTIEVGGHPDDWEGVWWTMPYVTRWYRGSDVPGKGTPRADRFFFRAIANKGIVCPGGGDVSQIPDLARMSTEYCAALPRMRRPYQLPDQAGVLWLDSRDDQNGLLFSFASNQIIRVSAPDLLVQYGLQRGPEKDTRMQ